MAAPSSPALPRIAIHYCTQCRWLLRAAYYAQELLTTFGAALGEVALVPAVGGKFAVVLTYRASTEAEAADEGGAQVREVLLWDRKKEGGFPETKVLKQLVRDYVEPGRNLGHSDRAGKEGAAKKEAGGEEGGEDDAAATGADCDCTT